MSEETLIKSEPCCQEPRKKLNEILTLKVSVVALAVLLIVSNIILQRQIATIKQKVNTAVTGVFDK